MRAVSVASVLLVAIAVNASEAMWPETVVMIEEMKMLTPLRMSVPVVRERGEIRGPTILKVHVNTEAAVERVTVYESCGSPAHDEAAMHALRQAKFEPKVVEGRAREVTLVLPLHLPKPKYPSRG